MERRLLIACCCLLAWPQGAAAAKPQDKPPEYNAITLQGLNKVTGHVSTLEGPLGVVLNFDRLEIVARRCWKAPPEERPENAALLEISETRAGEAPKRIFLGWMFSSSPGLSGLEHPVYDVTVLSCETHKETDEDQDKDKNKKKAP